jgi:cytochrome c-type biogenesis protein CcmF
VQVFVAIIIGFLTAVGQYLSYKGGGKKGGFWKAIRLPVYIAIVLSVLTIIFIGIQYDEKTVSFQVNLYIALVASIFAVVANMHYWVVILKGKMKSAGASIGHIGFGMVLMGILISSSNKKVLSWNTTGINVIQKSPDAKNPAGNPMENITLFEGIKTEMDRDKKTGNFNYSVTYLRDTVDELDKKFFELKFVNKTGGIAKDSFYLYPDVLKNNKGMEGFSANPSSKHYWNKDIFVYVTSFQDHSKEDTIQFKLHQLKAGDSLFYSNGYVKLEKAIINPNANRPAGSNEVYLQMTVHSKEGLVYNAMPGIKINGQEMSMVQDTVRAQNLILSFNGVVDQAKGILNVGLKESSTLTNLITLKVYEFPFINILWMGVIIMTIGFGMSSYARIKQLKSA